MAGASASEDDGEDSDGTNSNTIECVEEVRYDLVVPGESFKLCAKRNRQREQLALERLAARARGEGAA